MSWAWSGKNMGKKRLSLVVIFGVWAGTVALGGERDPNQYDYTMPARERLFTGTLSGLVEAHHILGNGLDDLRLTGDRRELVFLHALSAAGMVVFDRNDVAVATSIVEILEPFGITVTGSTFLPEDRYDPDRMQVRFPIDPNDPDDCYELLRAQTRIPPRRLSKRRSFPKSIPSLLNLIA